jgi:hypothetical protein
MDPAAKFPKTSKVTAYRALLGVDVPTPTHMVQPETHQWD